eukprot:TRINITY_DN3184_c0_g1_i2.p1 TRINITY_DN3184_c0_g1~~TRINITY_DN3184_c0_g1_i2.p1  ORF type:complete len:645 (+),score=203.69 TRINITY_DN3184_c0_g1_i2:80-1936(+)
MGAVSSVALWVAGAAEAMDAFCRAKFGCSATVAAAAAAAAFFVGRILLRSLGRYGGTPRVEVSAEPDEREKVLAGKRKFNYESEWGKDLTVVPCWDPATLDYLGNMPAHSSADVEAMLARARAAQQQWCRSPFAQRRQLLRVMQRAVLENASTIATVACRESGKTMIDAMVGEITVTLEKLRWTAAHGEKWLTPEYRDSGLMNMHKTSRVEWTPVGVVGAIVPWNYPFHNVFNPIVAALFAGNAIVIKVSEYASWSTKYYGRLIQACLAAVGAPPDLVQFAVGYAETGSALVAGANRIIFVGSVEVGKKVMQAAARGPTPVILELGGKDPFIVCDDVDPESLAQLVVRGAYQNMGQNCAGPERFIVYDKIYDSFCSSVTAIVRQLNQGPPLSSDYIDCGACVHPPSLKNYQRLVDDAVAKGARVLAGGKAAAQDGQFFEPTVLADVTEDMLIAQEETFGPILSIFRVKGNSDDEAVRIANKCSFALGSCAHSADQRRAAAICSRLTAGMSSVNDIEGTTYLSQSLPFGGLNDSGFGRFAGPEGLRGLCNERSVVEPRAAFLKPSIPRPIAYPANGQGPTFCMGLNRLLYGHSIAVRLQGLFDIISASMPAAPAGKSAA